MATSDDSRFGYYVEDGKKQDAAIHGAILAEGEAPSRDDVLALMQRLGLTPDEAQALLPSERALSPTVLRQRFALERERAARLGVKFDPDQPRDEGGKWTSGGGDGGSAETGSSVSGGADLVTSPQARQAFVNKIGEQYGLTPVKLVEMPDYNRAHALAVAAGGNTIELNPDYWGNPDKMAQYAEEWNGLSIDQTPEGVLIHEMGHIANQQIKPPPGLSKRALLAWEQKKVDILNDYFSKPEQYVSALAGETPWEALAEAFSSMHFDKNNWAKDSQYHQIAADGAKNLWAQLWTHGGRDPKTGRKLS